MRKILLLRFSTSSHDIDFSSRFSTSSPDKGFSASLFNIFSWQRFSLFASEDLLTTETLRLRFSISSHAKDFSFLLFNILSWHRFSLPLLKIFSWRRFSHGKDYSLSLLNIFSWPSFFSLRFSISSNDNGFSFPLLKISLWQRFFLFASQHILLTERFLLRFPASSHSNDFSFSLRNNSSWQRLFVFASQTSKVVPATLITCAVRFGFEGRRKWPQASWIRWPSGFGVRGR